MNERLKIDLKGSVSDAVSETIKEIGGFAIFVVFVGCLFAPVFATLFENPLHEKYDTAHHYDRYPLVEQKMQSVKKVLWCVALASWAFVVVCYLCR